MSTKKSSAMVEVFLTALEAAGEQVKRELLFEMLKNKDLREDIEAALLWDERKDQPSRDLKDIMAEWNDEAAQ